MRGLPADVPKTRARSGFWRGVEFFYSFIYRAGSGFAMHGREMYQGPYKLSRGNVMRGNFWN
jgi:hypothetical protein